MERVQLDLDKNGHGHFYIVENGEQIAKMIIGIYEKELTVYHTEVLPKAEGRGLAKDLLNAMVTYARENNLQVIALCTYVFDQFKRHPDEYKDVWKNKPE
ncbi:MAG: GNAT family N-acetyltransferase [Ferruginibacter sp.]